MNQSNNSHRFNSQLTNKTSGMGITDRGSDLHEIYEGSGIQFIPPQHKYIELEKFKSPFFQDNGEQEYVIQRAFQANNFTYLRNLPDNFSRNCILEERKERVKDLLLDETTKRMRTPFESQQERRSKIDQIKKTKIGTLGYFQIFPYQESDYQLPKKLAIKERIENVEKRKQVSEKDFRPMGFDRKMKYEDPFRYVDRLDSTTALANTAEKYLFPFHLPEDAYDSFKESQKRRKIVEKQLILAGEFYPSQKQYSLNTVSKAKMPQILNQIEYYFKKFLKGAYGYFIGVNKRDHIQVLFQSKYIDDPKLQMAMSGILEHEILSKFMLKRNFQRWGTLNEKTNYLEFVILPPWVKQPQEKLRAPTAPTNSSQSRRKQL